MNRLNSFCRGDLEVVEMYKKKLEQSLAEYESSEVKAAVARSKSSTKSAVARRRISTSASTSASSTATISTTPTASAASGVSPTSSMASGASSSSSSSPASGAGPSSLAGPGSTPQLTADNDDAQADVADKRQMMQLCQLNYLRMLCEIHTKKDCAILGAFSAYLSALETFSNSAALVLTRIAPELREISTAASDEFARYSESVMGVDMRDLLGTAASLSAAKVKKQGYLMIRKLKTKSTKKRWLDLEGTTLIVYRSHKETGAPVMQLDVAQLSIRSNSAQPTVLLLIKADSESVCLVASSAEEMEGWSRALEASIKRGRADSASPSGRDVANDAAALLGAVASKAKNEATSAAAILYKASEANQRCADCAVPLPAWVNVAFGVLVCSSCLGAHRAAMPTALIVPLVSVDADPEVLIALKRLGNALANRVLESALPRQLKPHAQSEALARARFVNAKYCLKRFLEPREEEESTAVLRALFFQSIKSDDLESVYGVVMTGLDLTATGEGNSERSVLHELIAQGDVSASCFLFLLHATRGAAAAATLMDSSGDTLLHYCAQYDRGALARSLLKVGADPRQRNSDNLEVVELAQKRGSREVLKVLAAHAESAGGTAAAAVPAVATVGAASALPAASPSARISGKIRSSDDLHAASEDQLLAENGEARSPGLADVKAAARENIVAVQGALAAIRASALVQRCGSDSAVPEDPNDALLSLLGALQASSRALSLKTNP